MTDKKSALRKEAFAARKAAHEAGHDHVANDHLIGLLDTMAGAVVAAYMPIRTELSPLPTMEHLCARGRRVCVPVIRGPGQALDFREWRPGCVMVNGPFGAAVPQDGATLTPAIVITPLVAWDRTGGRLGYGGGFYDRSFAELGTARAVGFAYGAQELLSVPREPTDWPLDLIVTETGVLQPAHPDPDLAPGTPGA
ncbi:MAG: 5-formyltetrahydrofolate cyclo-ligase [Pseudomonadota bacterium]